MKRETLVLSGISVDRYSWTDSNGRTRTVSLKRQDPANAGPGGYAIQMTYDAQEGAVWRTITVNAGAGGDGGFGYFVSHEQYRDFGGGNYATIAGLRGEDDSPLGLGIDVNNTSRSAITAASTSATISFSQSYPRWGTVAAMADVGAQVSNAPAGHKKFVLPVTIQWTFQKGMDFPRIDTKIDMSAAQAGQMAMDFRGPYGVMEFADSDASATLVNASFADSGYQFGTAVLTDSYMKSNSDWSWTAPRGTSRLFHALSAKHSTTKTIYEIGLIEHKIGADTGLVNVAYDYQWTKTSANAAVKPLTDFNWPYQSVQQAGLSAFPSTGKKFAWGSASFYGSANTSIFNGNTGSSTPFTGYPASKAIVYRTCLVLAANRLTSLTSSLANGAAALSCPSVSPLN